MDSRLRGNDKSCYRIIETLGIVVFDRGLAGLSKQGK